MPFLSAQHIPLLPWSTHSPDMPPIEHVWDFVTRQHAHHGCPAANTDEVWVWIEAVWNAIPQVHIQNFFDSMPLRVEALIVAHGSFTKY